MVKKIWMPLFALFAVCAALSACNGGDEDEWDSPEPKPGPEPEPEYPRTFTRVADRVAEFKVYVGSPEGAVLMENHALTPEYFWRERMAIYPPERISFDDENIMSYPDKGWMPDRYRFSNDSLFRLLPHRDEDEWEWSAKRTGGKMDFHVGYYFLLARSEMGVVGGIGQANEWVKPENKFYDFPASFTDVRDTVAVCNIIYSYEPDKNL